MLGSQPWIFIGRTNAEAETPILWPPDGKSWLIGKDPDAGKGWRQREKGTTEDEMVRWHHRLNEHEFEQALGVGDGQGGLVCCSPWGHNESDTTEWLNWTEYRIRLKSRFFFHPFPLNRSHWDSTSVCDQRQVPKGSCVIMLSSRAPSGAGVLLSFLKSFIEFYPILLQFCFAPWPWGLWNPSSLTRDWTWIPLHWKAKSQPLDR